MKKITAMALIAVMGISVLAGCGKKEEKGQEASGKVTAQVVDVKLTDEQYAFGVDKTQPELLEKVNAAIKKMKDDGTMDKIFDKYFSNGKPEAVKSAKLDPSKEQLVVATNAAFEPFEYTKGEDYYGIDMEIAKLLADELGQELVIQNMDFDAVCLSVGQQKCDIAMAGLTINEERKEYVNFTDSYYEASQKLIVRSGDKVFADLTDKDAVLEKLNALTDSDTIGVQQGTTAQYFVEGDADWGFDGLKAKCVPYKNGSLAVQDLLNGKVSYVMIDAAPAAAITTAINEMQ